jgi:predicted nucleic acid-binding protein
VLIEAERSASQLRVPAAHLLAHWIERDVGTDEDLAIAAITASELLHGVHRADPAHRARREALVESFIAAIPVRPFDLLCARAHASLWATLAASGRDIGAHERLVAATAIAIGWRVATANRREFARVPGLTVVHVTTQP